jgi:hypothetical protein
VAITKLRLPGDKEERIEMRLTAVIILLTIFLFPEISPAISVDIWETGMTINEVVSKAKEHNIPIARSGVVTMSRGFDPKLINDDFYKASSVDYGTKITERQATICLRFTDESRLVYEIETKVFAHRLMEGYTKELLKIMKDKYGSPQEKMDTVFKVYEWMPDKESMISMRPYGGTVTITYTDIGMKRALEDQRKQKDKDSVGKDAGKF